MRPRGFSLLEVMIACAILAIAGLALAASLAHGQELSHAPREEAIAGSAIRSVLAEMAGAPFSEVANGYHRRWFPVPPLRAPRDDPDGFPGEIEIAYGPVGDQSFYAVTVRVRWDGIKGVRVLESVSYLSNVRGDTGTPVPLESVEPGGGIPLIPGS
jgi:prepilin-type N-terminal cleavage/methylation domain-containing protein